jgi:putative endopeptidase
MRMNSAIKKSVIAFACFAASAFGAEGLDKPEYGAWGVDLTAMDLKVKPGDDFNRYASGAWMSRTTIPADKPMASLRYVMTDRTEGRLHQLMETAAGAPAQPATLEEKIGGFYKSFMDEAKIAALGNLRRIGKVSQSLWGATPTVFLPQFSR